MQMQAYNYPLPAGWFLSNEKPLNAAACSMLRDFGYAADPDKPLSEALPEVCSITRHGPRPGDLVEVDGNGGWMGVKPGDKLMLASCDSPRRLNIGRGHHYKTEQGQVSLSNGGPSSIIGMRTEVLRRSERIERASYWRFHLNPEASGGVEFSRPVSVWLWDGSPKAFDKELQEAA
jgi:hypothetical protein